MEIDDKVLKEYLKKSNCRGCYNKCTLDNPICGRSKLFIKEIIEKINKKFFIISLLFGVHFII